MGNLCLQGDGEDVVVEPEEPPGKCGETEKEGPVLHIPPLVPKKLSMIDLETGQQLLYGAALEVDTPRREPSRKILRRQSTGFIKVPARYCSKQEMDDHNAQCDREGVPELRESLMSKPLPVGPAICGLSPSEVLVVKSPNGNNSSKSITRSIASGKSRSNENAVAMFNPSAPYGA